MGCGSQTTTQKTEFPEKSPEEERFWKLGADFVTQGIISQFFTVKSTTEKKYKNPGAVEGWQKEIDKLEKQRADLMASTDKTGQDKLRYDAYGPPRVGFKGGAIAGAGPVPKNELGYIDDRLDKLREKMDKAEEESEMITTDKLLKKAPTFVQQAINIMPDAQRSQMESVLNNYGYDSKEFRQASKNVKVKKGTFNGGS